eukprot:Awhi_evm1s8675
MNQRKITSTENMNNESIKDTADQNYVPFSTNSITTKINTNFTDIAANFVNSMNNNSINNNNNNNTQSNSSDCHNNYNAMIRNDGNSDNDDKVDNARINCNENAINIDADLNDKKKTKALSRMNDPESDDSEACVYSNIDVMANKFIKQNDRIITCTTLTNKTHAGIGNEKEQGHLNQSRMNTNAIGSESAMVKVINCCNKNEKDQGSQEQYRTNLNAILSLESAKACDCRYRSTISRENHAQKSYIDK